MPQRIVINLDGPATEGTKPIRNKRKRWPRVLAFLAAVVLVFVVVAAVGGYLLWRWYQSSPTYAIALMLDAAQRNDAAEFQKRIDEEALAEGMAVSIKEKAAARYGGALDSSLQQKIDGALTAMLPRLKQTIHDECLSAMKSFAAAPEQRSFISILGAVQSLMTVTRWGNSAKATGKLAGRDIELAMRLDDDGWKLIDIKDELLLQRVVDSVMKELPAIGSGDVEFPFMKKAKPKRSRRGR